MIAVIPAKDNLPSLTEELVDTYAEVGGTVHLGRWPLPTYNTVVSIVEDLKSVLFPGYRRRDSLHLSNLVYHIGNLVDTLYDRLTQQIERAMNYGSLAHRSGGSPNGQDHGAIAQATTQAFLDQLPRLRRIVSLDAEAAVAGDRSCRSIEEVIYCFPGFEAVSVYRPRHSLLLCKGNGCQRKVTAFREGRRPRRTGCTAIVTATIERKVAWN